MDMIGMTVRHRINRFDISRKEILIVVALLILVGGIILAATWIRSGGLVVPTRINVVETASSGSLKGSISHISVKDVTSSTATVSWVTTDAGSIRIQYGIREDQLGYTKDAFSGVSQMTLVDLLPRKRYFFRIIVASASVPIISDIYSFITTN